MAIINPINYIYLNNIEITNNYAINKGGGIFI